MRSCPSSSLAMYPKAEMGSHGLAPPAARRHSDPHDYPPPKEATHNWRRRAVVSLGQRRQVMKKLLTLLFALSIFTSLSLVAQDTAAQDSADQMKTHTSTKAASVTGKISDDGKS